MDDRARAAGQEWLLSAETVSLVLIWVGAFTFFYGATTLRAAAFPMAFLLLMVPIPESILGRVINLLQSGSTDIAYFLFRTAGVPVLRQGFLLTVPGVTIEVAKECSGIRSSMALFITCLLAAHLFLRTGWRKLLFVLLAFPVALIKNGVRIVTLTLLSVYVDPSFLTGNLHHKGGIVFFLLALLILAPVLMLLEKIGTDSRSSDCRQFQRRPKPGSCPANLRGRKLCLQFQYRKDCLKESGNVATTMKRVADTMGNCDIAILGAGPYGLVAASHLKEIRGLEVRVFGEPMSFWDRNMPVGMFLRSNWTATQIAAPNDRFTLEAFETASGIRFAQPVPLDCFVQYGRWYQQNAVSDLDQRTIVKIEREQKQISNSSRGW